MACKVSPFGNLYPTCQATQNHQADGRLGASLL